MGAWSKDSKTHVTHMDGGDFFSNEQSATIAQAGSVRIELAGADGSVTVLKQKTAYEISRSDWSSDVCSSDRYARCPPGRS